MAPTAGLHYPRTYDEFRSWFSTDDDCRSYLDWLRWGEGFQCPICGKPSSGWRRSDGKRHCGACDSVLSVTAGTVFDKTRLPLTTWFQAAWYMTQQTTGVSAFGLKRELGMGSTGTAWHLLHRYRAAMVRFTRPKLSGDVEVDETYLGGPKPGAPGRGAAGKVIVGVAVELHNPKGYGRCRLQVLQGVSAAHLHPFVAANIEVPSVVITDDWGGYNGIDQLGYTRKTHSIRRSGHKAHELLPAVHRVASQLKRWLTGTHQGAVSPEHMQSYLEEFTFRWNRRSSRKRGLLFYRLMECAVAAPPLRYDTLVKVQRAKTVHPTPPESPQLRHRPLDIEHRPWLGATMK